MDAYLKKGEKYLFKLERERIIDEYTFRSMSANFQNNGGMKAPEQKVAYKNGNRRRARRYTNVNGYSRELNFNPS